MNNPWTRYPQPLKAVEPLPRPANLGFVTASADHPVPQSADLGVENPNAFHIARNRIIVREPTYYTAQPFSRLLQGSMHPLDQLRFDLFQFPAESLSDGLPADAEPAQPAHRTDMREA